MEQKTEYLQARMVTSESEMLLPDVRLLESYIKKGEFENAQIIANSIHKQLAKMNKLKK